MMFSRLRKNGECQSSLASQQQQTSDRDRERCKDVLQDRNRKGETSGNDRTATVIEYSKAESSIEFEVWTAVSSLPWRWQSRKSRQKSKRAAIKRSLRNAESGEKPVKNSVQSASSSAEEEVVLQRLMNIFAREDWSTEIEKPDFLTRDDVSSKNHRDNHVGCSTTDSITFTEIDIGSPLSPNSLSKEQSNNSIGIERNDRVAEECDSIGSFFYHGNKKLEFKTPTKGSSSHWTSARFNNSPGSWIFSALSPITPLVAEHITKKAHLRRSNKKESEARRSCAITVSRSPFETRSYKKPPKRSLDVAINEPAVALLNRVMKMKCLEPLNKEQEMYISNEGNHENDMNYCNMTGTEKIEAKQEAKCLDKSFPSPTKPSLAYTPKQNSSISQKFTDEESISSAIQENKRNAPAENKVSCSEVEHDATLESDLTTFWTELIVPNWQTIISRQILVLEKKTSIHRISFSNLQANSALRRLWSEGLPQSARQHLWPLAVGNELKITQELFDICCKQSRKRGESESLWQLPYSLMSPLEMDIQRTVDESHLSYVLQSRPNIKSDMLAVLEAFAQYRPDVGYVQGMTYICSILLLYLEPTMAFICFVNLVSQDIFMSFFRFSNNRREKFLTSISQIIKAQYPDLNGHMEELGITPDMYLVEWLVTFFSRSLRFECLARLWDCYALDGVSAIYRATLSVLMVLKSSILSADSIESCLPILKYKPMSITESELFDCYRVLSIKSTDVTNLCAIADECYSPRPVEVKTLQGKIAMRVQVTPKGSVSPVKMKSGLSSGGTSVGKTGSLSSYSESPLSPIRGILEETSLSSSGRTNY